MSTQRLRSQMAHAWQQHGRRARDLGFWSVVNYRFGRFAAESRSVALRLAGARVYGVVALFLDVTAGMQLNREARIGEELHIVHGWNIKVHPDAVIGARVGIMHDVTIGTTPDSDGVATIGDDVFIGAGARILGGVTIGAGARIGANSLVIADVPAGATAVGVPARILRYTGRVIPGEPAPTPTPNDHAPLAPVVAYFATTGAQLPAAGPHAPQEPVAEDATG